MANIKVTNEAKDELVKILNENEKKCIRINIQGVG